MDTDWASLGNYRYEPTATLDPSAQKTRYRSHTKDYLEMTLHLNTRKPHQYRIF